MSTDLALALPSPVGNLEAYLQSVRSQPLLSAEEERDLALRYRENDDLTAAWALVTAHLRFVVKISRGYAGYGLPQEDLIQEGNVGLMKAVKRFDPTSGVRLVSYAVHWIRAEIHEFVLKNWRIAKIATTKAQRKLFFNLRSAKKRLAWLTEAERKTLADDLDVDVQEVLEMEKRLSGHDQSFDATPDADAEACTAPAAYLEDWRFEPEQCVSEQEWEGHTRDRMYSAMDTLDERSRDILAQRWLVEEDEKATLQELADKYGVSAERIRQLENNAIKKLRRTLVQ